MLSAKSTKSLFALMFALLLGVRLLSPAGFMPTFANGGVAIVACPDAGTPPVHQGHDKQKVAQHCPYAAATALSTLATTSGLFLALLFFPVAWLFAARVHAPTGQPRLRPPATGPPILT